MQINSPWVCLCYLSCWTVSFLSREGVWNYLKTQYTPNLPPSTIPPIPVHGHSATIAMRSPNWITEVLHPDSLKPHLPQHIDAVCWNLDTVLTSIGAWFPIVSSLRPRTFPTHDPYLAQGWAEVLNVLEWKNSTLSDQHSPSVLPEVLLLSIALLFIPRANAMGAVCHPDSPLPWDARSPKHADISPSPGIAFQKQAVSCWGQLTSNYWSVLAGVVPAMGSTGTVAWYNNCWPDRTIEWPFKGVAEVPAWERHPVGFGYHSSGRRIYPKSMTI